jgi:hypothetical protein
MVAWVIHLSRLLVESFMIIIYPLCPATLFHMCVIPANKPKVTSFHFLDLLVSTAPLQLIFSNVWGPASSSVGNNNYYVFFIDDFSKFTWLYVLKHKSEVY